MKGLILIFSLCAALLLAACGSSSNNSSGGSSGGGGGSTGSVTGIAACDEYIAKVEKCMNSPKWPEQIKSTYKQNLEQYRNAWKQAASTPEGKAALEAQCKTVLQSAAVALDSCQ